MSVNIVDRIDDLVSVRHVLISVSDKSGLERFVPRLLEITPDIRIFSTGGTFKRLAEILGGRAEKCLTQVSAYTGQPETQGGLVKTLDFKIYLGLLTETYNAAHQQDLARTAGVPIGGGQELSAGRIGGGPRRLPRASRSSAGRCRQPPSGPAL